MTGSGTGGQVPDWLRAWSVTAVASLLSYPCELLYLNLEITTVDDLERKRLQNVGVAKVINPGVWNHVAYLHSREMSRPVFMVPSSLQIMIA